MFEIIIVIGILLGLAALAFLTTLSIGTLVGGALGLFAIGFGIGLPAAAAYHHRLRKVMRARGVEDNDWLWNPVSLNKTLSPSERRYVLPIFFVGGFGFLVVLVGILVLSAAVLVPG